MTRLNGRLLLVVATIAACSSSSGPPVTGTPKRSVAGQLKVAVSKRVLTKSGATMAPTAADLLAIQLKNRRSIRAQKSLPFARALARKFQPLNNKLIQPRPPINGAPSASGLAQDAFGSNVAVFAYDDSAGVYIDAQYLDTLTGAFNLQVVDDSPISIWTGTYDMAAGNGSVVLPISYGFNDDIPPSSADISFDYDLYFNVPPASITFDDAYTPVANDQSGYYEFAYSGGTAYVYLLPDDPAFGSYYLIWDDGTCSQGTQVYIAFDSTGNYFTVNGVDAAFSLSGVTDMPGYFSGNNIRWDVVGDDGNTYEDIVTSTYLGDVSTGPSCPGGTLVDPCSATGLCSITCPAGCSLDQAFGICTIDGTYDSSTGIGVSCDLAAISQTLILCPSGCAELIPADGYCYVNGNPNAPICY